MDALLRHDDTGEIGHNSAPLVEAALLDQIALTPTGVVADLRAVTCLDFAGIRALISWQPGWNSCRLRTSAKSSLLV
ncbi:hypothetical protein GCM10011609_06280 [Lentzea pudingi]|uniref:STAS domain-containing protein n=1 Tax=Lentzea pudingi TaxID=1789439 RepID=A0ABQ2HC02_9PSEU|nr:hypothetical protein [Lentzea pudingi]GGM73168.1 hypothetical protein GCM10011609_06280 [Lentzea pudingi]